MGRAKYCAPHERFGLAVLGIVILVAACSNAGATTQTVRLKWRDNLSTGENANWETRGDLPFRKEPSLGKVDVGRGYVKLAERDLLPFIYNYHRHHLYMDLNRNGDLTDDTSFPLRVRSKGNTEIAEQTVEIVTSGTPARRYVLRAADGNKRIPDFQIESGWAGEIELAGQRFELEVWDDLDGVFGPVPQDRDIFVPWQRDGFGLKPILADGATTQSLWETPNFENRQALFLGGRQYLFDFQFVDAENGAEIEASIGTYELPLAPVAIVGEHIRGFCMSGNTSDGIKTITHIVAYGTSASMYLPTGRYDDVASELESTTGKTQIVHWYEHEPIIGDGGTSIVVGGPLVPVCQISRDRRELYVRCEFENAIGQEARLDFEEKDSPPICVISDGEEVVERGDFRYG